MPGQVLVRAGQRVEQSDVVAQTTLTSVPTHVDIAADLGVPPAAVPKRLLVTTGTQVERGQVLAQKGGMGTRTSRSPVTGTFTSLDPATGIGLITTPDEPVSLQAHLKGIVTDVIPYYGAIVETPATLVRGIFGVGGEQHGVLKVVTASNDESMTVQMIDAKVTYAIVLGGADVTAEALRKMVELGARGVIVGSIKVSELADFMGYPGTGVESWKLGVSVQGSNGWVFPPSGPGPVAAVPPDFSIIVIEGFGSMPMNPRIFELLASSDGQEIAVDATTRLRRGLARPEIIIPLARTTAVRWLEESGPKLAVGKSVRLLSPAYLGQAAQVVGLPVGPRAAQSGVVTSCADIALPGGERMRVPVADIEVLE